MVQCGLDRFGEIRPISEVSCAAMVPPTDSNNITICTNAVVVGNCAVWGPLDRGPRKSGNEKGHDVGHGPTRVGGASLPLLAFTAYAFIIRHLRDYCA